MNKHFTSIYQRYFIMTILLFSIAFSALAASFLTVTYRFALRENKDALDEDVSNLSNMISHFSEDSSIDDPLIGLTIEYAEPDGDVLLCDTTGEIIYSYDKEKSDDSLKGSKIERSILRQIDKSGQFRSVTDLDVYKAKKAVSGVRIEDKNKNLIGYLFVAASIKNLTAMWRSFGILFEISALSVLGICIVLSYFIAKQQVKPLKEVTDKINHFGMGEYSIRISEDNCSRSDEIGQLATAFNNMAESIANSEQRRQEFVANISHELKTPMTTIAGFTDGILDGTIPPEKQSEALTIISDETRRLNRLVRRMLDVSQLSAKEQEVVTQSKFNITDVIAQVLISLERKITDKHLDVDAQFPDRDVIVWGASDEITQVCYNLTENAIKFAHEGTKILVSIVPKGRKAYISIKDVGETIPPEELPLIFDRFHKSDRSRSIDKDGVGLGLYIVKTIINKHNESINVTSENNITTFTFTLTLAE